MDEHHRAVGSNPTSSAWPINRLYALIRRLFTDEFVSHFDSRAESIGGSVVTELETSPKTPTPAPLAAFQW
jgi:hypothetical protein